MKPTHFPIHAELAAQRYGLGRSPSAAAPGEVPPVDGYVAGSTNIAVFTNIAVSASRIRWGAHHQHLRSTAP